MKATTTTANNASVPGAGLEVTGLRRYFGEIRAVDGIDLTVAPGQTVGFLGSNGAGKTTTMRMILNIIAPDSGRVSWNGAPVTNEVRNVIGYMPQERGLYARMRVFEQIRYFGQLAGLTKSVAGERADYWIERVGLTERRTDNVQELSGGNQQRVQLAVSLVHDPMLLILDEPFAGLDPLAAEAMQEIISERSAAGASVLLSSHQLDLVEGLCDSVIIISHGRHVASGRAMDLRMAAPTRSLRVEWAQDVGEWSPLAGEVIHFDGRRAEVAIEATSDVSAQIDHAVSAGPVIAMSVEPPSLGDVFADSVAPSDMAEAVAQDPVISKGEEA